MSPAPFSSGMREAFWETLCPYLGFFSFMFMISVVLLVLQLFTVPFVEAGTATYYISVVTIVVLTASLVGTGVVIRKCRAIQG